MSYKCKICDREFNKVVSLSNHITQKHKVQKQQYYLSYLNGDKKQCQNQHCTNNTSFIDMNSGYRRFCSTKCRNTSKKMILQCKQRLINRYGVRVPVQNDNIKQKIRLTTISNYGAIGFASEELRKKIKKSYAIQKQYKLKDGRIINYQSNLQKKFIIFCQKKNILIYDGDIIEYTFKEKVHKYFIDFRVVLNQINFLVQIKGMHPYYRESINGGSMLAKYNGVLQYLKDKDNYQYTFIVGENFNELYR